MSDRTESWARRLLVFVLGQFGIVPGDRRRPPGQAGGVKVSGEKKTVSGPKGFAIVLIGMLGIMAVLWGLAALVAP
ncbi:hypothetical protein [Actinomadura hibisca]|uniref:hypothetical protein n=1 Tax=Actinomadura hibisca TaxID=68565 RepID=UPI0008352AEB|nr:hypothetical protein [Actinomadura hibisca]